MALIKIPILVALLKLLLTSRKPFLCSGLYAFVVLWFNFLFVSDFGTVLVRTLIAFGLSSVYFWVLNRLEGSGMIWWVVLTGGLSIGFV